MAESPFRFRNADLEYPAPVNALNMQPIIDAVFLLMLRYREKTGKSLEVESVGMTEDRIMQIRFKEKG